MIGSVLPVSMNFLISSPMHHEHCLGYAVSAELVAVLLFSLLGSSAPSDTAAWANGFSLAVLGEDSGSRALSLYISSAAAWTCCLTALCFSLREM